MKRRQDRWLPHRPPEEGGQEWHQGWGTLPRVCSDCPGMSLGTWEFPAQAGTGRGERLRGPASRSPGLGDLQPILHLPPSLQKEAQEPGCTLQRCWILPLAAGGAFQ